MPLHFASEIYNDNHNNTFWKGIQFDDCPELITFLEDSVKSRLCDYALTDSLESIIDGLAITDMQSDNIKERLLEEDPCMLSWAAGEALAEAFLIENNNVVFPWNMNRDKRTGSASLPGADIVGFVEDNGRIKFAFGEVKTSQEQKHPPQVMTGRSGMRFQIYTLADKTNESALIRWLWSRVDGKTQHVESFRSALTEYIVSEPDEMALFGILLRDTDHDSRDLSRIGTEIGTKIGLRKCELFALYMPWELEKMMSHLGLGEDNE